jgi:hypothetical protein
MALQKALDELRESFESSIGDHTARIMADFTRSLKESNLLGKALRQGQRFPEFELPADTGETVRLVEILSRGPAAILFYRGKW